MEKATDAGGKDLRPTKRDKNVVEQIAIAEDMSVIGNMAGESFLLKDFDIDKGLKELRGRLRIAETVDIRIPVEKGKEVETPRGTIVVDSIHEQERRGLKGWRIGLTYRPEDRKQTVAQAFEGRVKYDGSRFAWRLLRMDALHSFDVETLSQAEQPKWLMLRALKDEPTIVVPFEFSDVVFKKK